MGSNYYGEANLGNNNERGRSIGSSSSSSSSRKGKKSSSITTTSSSNSDKPKQPQRGLGVAQLEKMRLHGALSTSFAYHQYPTSFHTPNHEDQMRLVNNNSTAAYCSIPSSSFCNYSSSSSSPSYGFNTNIMMGLSEYERANIRYGDSQPCTTTPSWDSSTTIFDNPHFVQPNSNSTGHLLNQQDYHEQMRGERHTRGSSSPNYELSENQELDLELRLAL